MIFPRITYALVCRTSRGSRSRPQSGTHRTEHTAREHGEDSQSDEDPVSEEEPSESSAAEEEEEVRHEEQMLAILFDGYTKRIRTAWAATLAMQVTYIYI